MKVLAISIMEFSLLSDKRNGTALYVASLIQSLAEISKTETCLLDYQSHLSLPAGWTVKLFPRSPIGNFLLRQVKSISLGIRAAVWQHHSVALSHYLRSLESEQFDIVVFLEESACIFEKFIPKNIPRILVRHNLDSQSTKIEFGSPVRLIRSVMTRYLSRRFDRWTVSKFSAVTIGSKSEAKILEKIGVGGKVSWLPTISLHDIPDQAIPAPKADPSGLLKAVFIGDFRYGPNVDAVKWFLGCDIYLKKTTLIKLDVLLVGRNPPEFNVPSSIRISKLGFVPDLSQVLESCEIGLIPVVSGSGVKIKALTLLGSGIPVVSTPDGVEGLGVEHGVHCLIARTQKEFASAIEKLHEDGELRERLRMEARSFILNNFSKNNQVDALKLLLARVTKRSAQSCA